MSRSEIPQPWSWEYTHDRRRMLVLQLLKKLDDLNL